MAKKMRQAVKILSRRLQAEPSSDSGSSTEEDSTLSIPIPRNLDNELILFLVQCLENQKKTFSQISTIDQIQAALPKMGSSPHDSLMDQLSRALHHHMKYQKLTVLVQSSGVKESATGVVVLSEEDWGKIQMLLTILIQHFDEPLLHAILVKTILNRENGKLLEAVHWARTGLALCDADTPPWLTDLIKRALAVSLSNASANSVLSKQERINFRYCF